MYEIRFKWHQNQRIRIDKSVFHAIRQSICLRRLTAWWSDDKAKVEFGSIFGDKIQFQPLRRVDIDSAQSQALVWTAKSECRSIPKFRLLAPCPCDTCHMDMDLDEKTYIGAF